MKNRNTCNFLLAAALIGGCFAASAMETDKKQLGEKICKAAEKGNLDELNRLIKAGADVNQKNQNGWTALLWAADQGHLKCVRALLNAQADPNIMGMGGGCKATALMRAALFNHHEIVDLLINAKANIEIQDGRGSTALMNASLGNLESLRLLINAKAKLDIQDKEGATALYTAAYKGSLECIQLLINAHADIYILANDGEDALALAFYWKHDKCINTLIDAGADLRPTIKKFPYHAQQIKPLIMRSINLYHQQKSKTYALLWCMKKLTQNNGFNTDFVPFIAEPLFALPLEHKQMLEESIEMLENEHDKIELRAALNAEQNNHESI